MTSVLVAGVAVLDFVFHMDTFPDKPEKYRAKDSAIVGGGNAANSSVAIARLGGDARLAARLGDDQVADMILAGLANDGVDCTLVRRFQERRSSFSSIYLDASGERQIMNYRDNDLTMDVGWLVDTMPEQFDAALADTRWPDGALAAMEAAKARNVPGIIDAEAPVHEAEDALQIASHIAFSDQGASEFTGETDAERAALAAQAQLPGRVLVTHGERGVVTIDDGRPVWHAAFPVAVVDTLGAGDVWHGAFALALGEGQSEADAIRFASAAAAIKCTRSGGRDGAPTRAETEQFLEEHA